MVSSCLKIIACGSDSADKDDELERTESKGSTDKRGWSFRKKSTSHHVLSNNIIPDSPSTGSKEYPEPTNFDFPAQSKPAVPEIISVLQWPDEVTPLSTKVSKPVVPEKISILQLPELTPLSTEVSKPAVPEKTSVLQLPDEVTPLSTEMSKPAVPEKISALRLTDEVTILSSATENAIKSSPIVSTENSTTIDSPITLENVIKVDLNLEEPVAIVLQAAIRGYLAKRAFLKLKNVVKLQAAVRGLLVRRQAVGTLLCVQAIVKMQALVRARRARSLEGSVIEEQLDEKQEKSYKRALIKVNSETKAKTNYSSTQKLLRNGFARQLLESTPKKKQIRIIKCDPSRPDSSWKWFDRWTTVSSSKFTQPQKPEFASGYEEQGERIDATTFEVGTKIPAEVISESADFRFKLRETTMPIDVEENLSTYHADNFDSQVSHPTSSLIKDNTEQPKLEDDGLSADHGTSSKIDMNQTEMPLDATSQTMADSISYEPEADCEQLKPSVTTVASEQSEMKDKKMFGSRKACNPAFIAAKSKFEDLNLRTLSGRSINQDNGLEMQLDSLSYPANTVARTEEHSLTDNSISYCPRVYVGGSECGTELSISSTLDSPDRFEIEVREFDNETKVAEEVDGNLNGEIDIASNLGNLDFDAMNEVISQPISPYPVSSVLPGKVEDDNKETVDSVAAVETPSEDQKPEEAASDVRIQLDATTDHEAYLTSLDGSPGNNITAPELHETPSSKVSVKNKKNKLDKNGSTQTRKSRSASKKSPSNSTLDSGARSSTEKLQKDPKKGKKRSSFGSTRLDHVELEPRDSSSNSLPSYMQATESARAKAHVNNSPRSRSDVQEKEIYLKKRHSLPANGKQGSPRVQQLSTSERRQGANGNLTRTP